MTTLVYQNGTLYADTKFTKAMERTGLTFEEAYQASLANAKYAVEFGMTELEYKKVVDATFNHRFFDRQTLVISPTTKIIEINSDIDTNGRGKVLSYGLAGVLNAMPYIDEVFNNCTTLTEAFEKLNDFYYSSHQASGGDDLYYFTLLVKTDRGCFYFRPSLSGIPAVGFMSKYNTTAYYAVGSGPVAYLHGNNKEKFFTRTPYEDELDRYDGQIEDIDLFYAKCAAVDPMTNTVIDVH